MDLAPGGSKPLVFQKVLVTMSSGAPIGKVTGGWLNIQWQTFRAEAGEGPKQLTFISKEELRKAHYTLPADSSQLFGEDPSANVRYQLGAEIPWIQLDLHVSVGWTRPTFHADGGITVVWQVYDTVTKKIVFKKSVDTGYHQVTSGDAGVPALFDMYRQNLRRLLADPEFAAFMRPDPATPPPAQAAP